jgi:hypothetical protein
VLWTFEFDVNEFPDLEWTGFHPNPNYWPNLSTRSIQLLLSSAKRSRLARYGYRNGKKKV